MSEVGTQTKPTIETAADMGSKQDLLDFLVTQEQLGVTLVGAAIQNAPGTPSEGFLPVLKNGVTQEYHHVEALEEAGGNALTTSYWLPDTAFDEVASASSRPSKPSRRSKSAST